MHPNCPTSDGEDPILGLAKTVKGIAGSNVVQTISCYSVLGATLWYATIQSPAKYVRAMTAPLRGSTSCH